MTRAAYDAGRLDQHLDGTDFLVVDVETTGLSAEAGDRVCEIGAVKLRGGAVVATLASLIDPQRPISAGAYAVNRISPGMLLDAPPFSGIADRLWGLMQESVLVAYNAPFDHSFLATEFRLLGYPPILNPVVDALAMARRLLPGLPRYPQEQVARILGIPEPVRHRAQQDAMITATIFTIFTSILKAYDCTTVGDLNRADILQVLQERRMRILGDALSATRNVWIKYLSSSGGEITDSVVTPKEVVGTASHRGSGTLIAFCHTARSDRNFRIDRILDLRLMEQQAV